MQGRIRIVLSLAVSMLSHSLFAQWTTNTLINTPVCQANGKQIDLRMMEDGHRGTYIAWKDYRPSNGLPDIYVQHIDSAGVAQWTSKGVVICDESHDQSTPAIITDMRGGAIIAWSDWRSNIERDIYAQRINASGVVQWTVNGANVTNLSEREHSEKMVSDGKGGAIIVFEKQSAGIWDIWAQHLDSSGNKMWGAGGIAVTTVSGYRRNHKVQKDNNGGAIIAWQDLRNGVDYDIYAQRIDGSGNLLWGPAAKAICTASGDQINAKIESDSALNGAYIGWQDTRNSSNDDIYMQQIDSNGTPKWAPNGIVISNASGTQSALDMLSFSGGNEVIITWKDNRNGSDDIYAQKVGTLGSLQWNPTGVIICNAVYDQINPNICTDENKGAIIVWQDSSAGNWDVRAQRININGQVQWSTNGEIVCNAANGQTSPKNVSDGTGGTIVAWQDTRTGEEDIFVQRINKNYPAAVSNSEQAVIRIYPNPADDILILSSSATEPIQEVSLLNTCGQQVIAQKCVDQPSGPYSLSLTGVPAGYYLVRCVTNQAVYMQALLKK